MVAYIAGSCRDRVTAVSASVISEQGVAAARRVRRDGDVHGGDETAGWDLGGGGSHTNSNSDLPGRPRPAWRSLATQRGWTQWWRLDTPCYSRKPLQGVLLLQLGCLRGIRGCGDHAEKQRSGQPKCAPGAVILELLGLMGAYIAGSCRDMGASISIFVLAAAIFVLLVVICILKWKPPTPQNGQYQLQEEEQKKKMELQERQKLLLNLAVLAITITITITYQAGLTPPGGFWIKRADEEHHSGDPVLADNYHRWYMAYFICNAVSFMASVISIVFLLSLNLSEIAWGYRRALYLCVSVVVLGLMGAYASGTSRRMQESMYVVGLSSLGIVFAIPYIHYCYSTPTDDTRNSDGTPNPSDDDTETEHANQYISRHKMCKYLMLIAILAASITYQAGSSSQTTALMCCTAFFGMQK
uniref:PGG domain-containing protein n=1 Tax=Leersia perrieri TaxID=77586 RepID=A0A0D9WPG9_9ORYZ